LSQALGFSPDSLQALPALLQKKKPLKKVGTGSVAGGLMQTLENHDF
jgi:hypothetical protein